MFKQKLNRVITIFQWILTIVLISMVFLLIFTAFNPVKSFQILRVMSGSMEPSIHVGSIVFVQKVNPTTLKQNDIITFASTNDSNVSITHRLTGIEEKNGTTLYHTKGDANTSQDTSEISTSQIKGRVIFSLPYLGYLSVWIKKPLGFGLLVILPAILIIINEIFNIKKTIEKEVENKYKNSIGLSIVLCLIGIGLFQIKPINAYFFDTATIGGMTFSVTSKPDNHKQCRVETEVFHDKHGHFFRFKMHDCRGFKKIKYKLRYDTDRQRQGVNGEENFDDKDEFTSRPIRLGACTSDEVCVDDANPRHFDLNLDFLKEKDDKDGEKYFSYRDE
jgi:signal peptidase